MALADYHLCAVCGGKAFYDANVTDPCYVSSYDESEREFGHTIVKAICHRCSDKFDLIVTSKKDK